jgi:putative addiction module component (TIGR02574 family)
MIENNDHLIREATALSPLERLQLVDHLLESLDFPDKEIEELWAQEATKRWEGYQAGTIPSVSASEAFEKYKP